jgi:hypothetical protein
MALLQDSQRMYEGQAAELARVRAELKQVRDARDRAWWTLKTRGMENIEPPTCVGAYIEGRH